MVRVRKRSYKYEKPNKLKKRYYSFLTLGLLLCIVVLLFSTGLNILKIISYHGKVNDLKKQLVEVTEKNQDLKKQLNDLNARSYEAIARNNLKMAGEDEALIIIRKEDEENNVTSDNKKIKKNDKEKKD